VTKIARVQTYNNAGRYTHLDQVAPGVGHQETLPRPGKSATSDAHGQIKAEHQFVLNEALP
jgi:hypothetical protein